MVGAQYDAYVWSWSVAPGRKSLSADDVFAALPARLRTDRDFILEGIRSFGWDLRDLLPLIPAIVRDTDVELVRLAIQKVPEGVMVI